MALTPVDETHALQIQAGTLGRKAGHQFEDRITTELNDFKYPLNTNLPCGGHVFTGDPARLLLSYIASRLGHGRVFRASAISTGALATSEDGRKWLDVNGSSVSRCKSDLVISLSVDGRAVITSGVSTKQCNTRTPTNAQVYFTTARGFSTLLRNNQIAVSDNAINALRQFCGDAGFRPLDHPASMKNRKTDPRRYFWEEIEPHGRLEWETILTQRQDDVTRLLLQKAYMDDPFVPEFVLHKTNVGARLNLTSSAR